MAYAAFSDVEARAGRYASVFSVAGKQPDEETIETLLVNVSAELDAAIAARGHPVPVTDDAAEAALVDTTAYGVLARALASIPSGDDSLDDLREYAQSLWTAALAGIAKGTHVVILLLEAGGGGASAGDFWAENPDFGTDAQIASEARSLTSSLAPGFAKGQSL